MLRNSFLFFILLLLANNSFAQVKSLTADEKQKLKAAQASLDSLKKANPGIAGSIPDLNSLMKNVQVNNDKFQQVKNDQQNENTKNLPRLKPGISIKTIAIPAEAVMITMAKNKMAEALTKLDNISKARLDKLVNDTSINLAGTAMMMIANGIPKWEGQYLVCKDIIKRPANPWPVNDLAILYRDAKKFTEAISCFLYALKQNDKLLVIKTNLAWACSYYGDITAAKKYFNEVLAADENFSSALEGLAIIAYQEGDLQALFKCLMKEVTGFGGGGSGPSQEFTSLCGDISDMNTDDEDKDPTTDNTYDNVSNDDPGQDPPPGADEKAVKYPEMKQIFIGDAMELADFFTKVGDYQKTIQEEIAKADAIPNQKFKALPPLQSIPYIDDHGDKIVPYSYEKFFTLFGKVDALFEKRKRWFEKKYDEEMSKFLETLPAEQSDMQVRYYKALTDCNNKDACWDEVNCDWIPRFHGAKNGELESVKAIWNKYFNKMVESCNWYISASSPFIKRVHKQAINEYLNTEREWAIRRAFISMYERWIEALVSIRDNPLMRQTVTCRTELRLISDAPNPDAQQLKKLKTFAGPCYKDNDEPITLSIVTYEDNCERTKLSIEPGPFKFSAEKDYSPKYKEDDQFKLTVGIAVSKKISYKEKNGIEHPFGEGEIGASVSGEVSASIEDYWKFNSNGDLIARGMDANFEATAKGSVSATTGVEFIDNYIKPVKKSFGVSGSYEVEIQCGQNVPPNRQVTAHIEKTN